MNKFNILKIFFLCLLIITNIRSIILAQQSGEIPHLKEQGTATQLIIDNNPVLLFGGELGNSNASDLKYMEWVWDEVEKIGLNTLLMKVNLLMENGCLAEG
jgi:hypothetical protein